MSIDLRNIIDPPPADIVQAAEKVRTWMASQNRGTDWQLVGVCSREAVAARDNRIAELVDRLQRAEDDANRWRAFVGSARIRLQGSAGLNEPMPNNYAHMGMEIWTTFDRNYSPELLSDLDRENALGREWLTKYADVAVAAMADRAMPDDPLDDVLPLPATDPRPIAEAVLYNFDQVERFDDKRRGVVFVVDNPVECHDFNHLFGTEVIINSALWKVKGVERFAHCAPWRKGEKIGLQVEPVPAQPIDNFYSGQLGKPWAPDLPDSEGGHHD